MMRMVQRCRMALVFAMESSDILKAATASLEVEE